MMPHGAPTTWFSASWQSAARRSGSRSLRPRARAVATSRAALEATPTDAGRSDVISIRPRGRIDHAVAQQHQRHTDDVVRPAGVRRQLPANSGVGEAGQALQLGARREGDGTDDERVVGMGHDLGAPAGRHLEHERAGVVRHPTEEVETARRATPHAARPPAPPTRGRSAPPAPRWRSRPRRPGSRCPTGRPTGCPRDR